MRTILLSLCIALLAGIPRVASAQNTIKVFDTLLFFDGYASKVATPTPPAGVIRHRNDLYARMLTAQELQSIGNKLTMNVTIKASCDNYDRIGNVNLALVPKGASSYVPDSVQRIEIGRYITPFMNKNVQPNQVPYTYAVDNVAELLKETSLTTNYDIWIELEVFGVPYAANTQVAGCAGRNDVFYGSLEFVTAAPAAPQSNNVLIPLSFKKDLNNYQAKATDTLGKTTRTIQFNIPTDLSDAALFLITSNHGANNGGEEYNRRDHYVFFDNNLVRAYKPGSTTCEPLRMYNTQGNGIYGASPRSDAQWQSFSNWCPGDTIPIRRINLGALSSGAHSFMITVPDAVFIDAQGYFPVSLYLQGKTSGKLAVGQRSFNDPAVSVYPNPSTGMVTIEHTGAARMMEITVLNGIGQSVYHLNDVRSNLKTLDLGDLGTGLYIVHIRTDKGTVTQKLQIVK